MNKSILINFFLSCIIAPSFAQNTITRLFPVKDVTLYESVSGNISNGSGYNLLLGTDSLNNKRRILIQYDFSQIPTNATITNVLLKLESGSFYSNSLVSCHRVLSNWGEGMSNAGTNYYFGTSPMTNDATWIHNFYNSSLWNIPGGDYSPIFSDTLTLGNLGPHYFSSQQLVNDVQLFYDSVHLNHGWVIIGDENNINTLSEFHSRQSSIIQLHPDIIITYITTTGIIDNSEFNSVSIAPNPAQGFIDIQNVDEQKFNRYKIYSSNGKLITESRLTDHRINIEKLGSGAYIIQLINKENQLQSTTKFIKE